MSRPAGCASCTGLRISETADTLEGATLRRNATRNPTQYPFKFIRIRGPWEFHPFERPVTEPSVAEPSHAEPRGYLLPRGPVIKHTGPISGPLPLYARVAGTRLHACNLPQNRVGVMAFRQDFSPPPSRYARNTRTGECALPRAERRYYRRKDSKRMRMTAVHLYLPVFGRPGHGRAQ